MSLFPVWGVFETEIYCRRSRNISLNCHTDFWLGGGVKLFGGIKRGHIETNVDIAGRATIFAFLIPAAFILLFNFLLILSVALDRGNVKEKSKYLQKYLPRPGLRGRKSCEENSGYSEHMYNILESAIVIISDSQILLGLALAVSFIVIDRCKTLQYHFMIGINLLLLSSTSYLQSVAIIRRRPSFLGRLATILKVVAVSFILYFIGWVLVTQNSEPYKSKHPWVAERLPSSMRIDSVIFLKAACFLDPDFQKSALPAAAQHQKQTHRDIGLDKNTGDSYEWVFWVMLVVSTSIVFLVDLLGFFHGHFWCKSKPRMNSPPPANLTGGKWFDFIYWGYIWCLSLAVYIYVCKTIFPLRDWAFKSGWLKPNEIGGNAENDITGFGQSAALFSLAAVVFAMLEQASEASEKTLTQDEGNEYIRMV